MAGIIQQQLPVPTPAPTPKPAAFGGSPTIAGVAAPSSGIIASGMAGGAGGIPVLAPAASPLAKPGGPSPAPGAAPAPTATSGIQTGRMPVLLAPPAPTPTSDIQTGRAPILLAPPAPAPSAAPLMAPRIMTNTTAAFGGSTTDTSGAAPAPAAAGPIAAGAAGAVGGIPSLPPAGSPVVKPGAYNPTGIPTPAPSPTAAPNAPTGSTTPQWGPTAPATAPAPTAPAPNAAGTPAAPAPTPKPAPSTIREKLDSLPWLGSGKDKGSAQDLYDYIQASGGKVTAEMVDAEIGEKPGFTREMFAQYGIGAPGTGGTSGIIGNQLSVQAGDPTKWDVTADQTVEGRIAGIVEDKNNPLQVIARNNAKDEANSRGLVNSAMAVSAGERAAFESALPIAQADAATFAKAAGYNADQANQFALQNISAENQFRFAAQNNGFQKELAGMDISAQERMALTNRETQRMIGQMDIDSRRDAEKFANDNRTMLETNAQAAGVFNTAMSAINNISLNDKMDADTKTRATANVWRDVQVQFKVLGQVAGLNLEQKLNFAGYPGFDDKGVYVGFEEGPGAVTRRAAGTPAPAPAPATGPGGSGGADFGGSPGDTGAG